MTKRLAFLALILCFGCGRRDDNDLDAEERDVFDRGGESQLSSQAAFGLADDLFQFDPTLDAARTAAENATLVRDQALTQLAGCGSATLNGTTLTVSFGALPGCTLKSGRQVSGTVTLDLSKTNATTTVMVTFTQVMVDGTDLSGTASFSTTNATTFTVTANLTSKGATLSGTLTATGAPGAMTLDGTIMQSKSTGEPTSATFTAVVWKKSDCYPSAGTVKLTRGRITQTATFTPTTPSTGTVNLKVGLKTTTLTLPAYGTCPHA